MSQSLSGSSRSTEQIEIIQNLLEEIVQIQKENKNSDEEMQRIQEIVLEASKVVENSTLPNEMVMDANILHTGTHFMNTNIYSLNTNLTSFSEGKYTSGLLNYLENSSAMIPVTKEWERFAPLTYHLFKKSHPIQYMLGTFTLEPPPAKAKAKGERLKRAPAAQKSVLTSVTEKEKPAEEGSDIYNHILKWLVRHYKKNDRKPVCYFNFIIDPTDYWRTTENIFHFAFLVRDGNVKMSLQEGLPFVEPVLKNSENKTAKKDFNYQFCFSLSKSEWKECVNKFQIKTQSIPPFVKTT